MEDPYDENPQNSEEFDDVYRLKTEIDDSQLKKLRQELQQTRLDITKAEADVRRLRNSSTADPAALKTRMQELQTYQATQTRILEQMNNSILKQPETIGRITSALQYLNAEFQSTGLNAKNLSSTLSIVEAAMARMASISNKSDDYKKLESSLKDIGIEVDVSGVKKGTTDLSKLSSEIERVNSTPVSVKIENTELQTTVEQLQLIEILAKRVAAQLNKNVQLMTTIAGQESTIRVVTPSAGSSPANLQSRLPSGFDTTPATAVARQSPGPRPFEVVHGAMFGAGFMWPSRGVMIAGPRSAAEPRGTARRETMDSLVADGIVVESPARNQWGIDSQTKFLDVSNPKRLEENYEKYLKKIDPTIRGEFKHIGTRYAGGAQFTNRAQMSGVIENILGDKMISNMERAYEYQVAKILTLFNKEWQDVGTDPYWRRGTPGVNLSERQLAILNQVDQFGGGLQFSEITKSLGLGHYQSMNADKRELMRKGLLRNAIIPPLPVPEAGVYNQIHPMIMGLLGINPALFMEASLNASPIKLMETSERGRQALEMTGMIRDPSRINTGMQLNALVGNPEDTYVEGYRPRFKIPPGNDIWFRGFQHLIHGENAFGGKVAYFIEEMLNNREAYNKDFIDPLMQYIPTFTDESGRTRVNMEEFRGKESEFQFHPTSTAQYLNARSDINWALRTPYMFVDKVMENWGSPNRDLYADNMYGGDMWRRTVLNWATGPTGMGLNKQLEQYTVTPEQGLKYFSTLWGAFKMDQFLTENKDDYKQIHGKDYIPWTQYEKSIILRQANKMLERALPVTSGMELGVIESLRPRDYMWKGEKEDKAAQLAAITREERRALFEAVPDFGVFAREVDKYQKETIANFASAGRDISDVMGADFKPGRNITPDWLYKVNNDKNAPSSWKQYPQFYGSGYGKTYEDLYTQEWNIPNEIAGDPNAPLTGVSALGVPSLRAALNANMPIPKLVQYQKQISRMPIHGFTGILPWNANLDFFSQMGSQDLSPAAQKMYEGFMNNPESLMKELYSDMQELIDDTYGTIMKDRPQFGWVSKISNPEALNELRSINEKFATKFTPEGMNARYAEYEASGKMEEDYEKQFLNFTAFNWDNVHGNDKKGIEQNKGIFPLQFSRDTVVQHLQTKMERELSDAIQEWSSKYNLPYEPSESIGGFFKTDERGVPKTFFKYEKERVPQEEIIKRMIFDMQQGRMDPRLLDSYARSVSSQLTNPDKSLPADWVIERMWLRQGGVDYGANEDLRKLSDANIFKHFLMGGVDTPYSLFDKVNPSTTFDMGQYNESMGVDMNMLDEDTLDNLLRNNTEFREDVKRLFMENQDLTEDEVESYLNEQFQDARQRLKTGQRLQTYDAGIENSVNKHMENLYGNIRSDIEGYQEYVPPEVQETMSGMTSGMELIRSIREQYWGARNSKADRIAWHQEQASLTNEGANKAKKPSEASWAQFRKWDAARRRSYAKSLEPDESQWDMRQPADKMKYFIDIDGTLLDESHDLMFKDMIGNLGFDEAVKWYDSTEVDNLKLNEPLVQELLKLKEQGHELNIWTNRGANQIEMTKRNLGPLWDIFDNHIFREGRKGKDEVPGEIWDNEERYLKQGTSGRLVDFNSMVGDYEKKTLGKFDMRQPFGEHIPEWPGSIRPSIGQYDKKHMGSNVGYYNFIRNAIGVLEGVEDPDRILKHEMMHPVANEKLLQANVLSDMVGFYDQTNLNMFDHSLSVGEAAKKDQLSGSYTKNIAGYLNHLSKGKDKNKFESESIRLNPYATFFQNASGVDAATFAAMSEEIAIVMEKYDEDYQKHVTSLFGENPTFRQHAKTSYIRNIMGISTPMPTRPDYGMGISKPLLMDHSSAQRDLEAERVDKIINDFYSKYYPKDRSQRLLPIHEEALLLPEGTGWSSDGYGRSYTDIPGGTMIGGPSSPMNGILTGIGYNACVMREGQTSRRMTPEQIEAYRRRNMSGIASLPAGNEDIQDVEFNVVPDFSGVIDPKKYGPRDRMQVVKDYLANRFKGEIAQIKTFASKVSQKHQQNIEKHIKSLPDVSLHYPDRQVTERGMELPMNYKILPADFGGMEGARGELARILSSLKEKGFDTSLLKHDIISSFTEDKKTGRRIETGEINLAGRLRMSDKNTAGRSEKEIASLARGSMASELGMINEQAGRYEKTMPRVLSLTDRFGESGKKIASLSWHMTTLQMAALGVFFSMMSIVSVMGQGIGLVLGGLGDMEGMMKAKAMAGMSGQFTDKETGQVLTGDYIDNALGIDNETRTQAWKNFTDLTSTISTMLSGFGTKVMTDPKFLIAANDFVNRLFNVVKNPDSLKTAVSLSETLFETLGNLADKLPAIVGFFNMIASWKVPSFIPGLGGQSALSAYGQTALAALILMPILTISGTLIKILGWIGQLIGGVGGISRWIAGRNLEKNLLTKGVEPEITRAARLGFGVPGGMSGKMNPDDINAFRRSINPNMGDEAAEGIISRVKDRFTGAFDNIKFPSASLEREGSRVVKVFEGIASRLEPVLAKIPELKVPVAAAAVVTGGAKIVEGEASKAPLSKLATVGGITSRIPFVGGLIESITSSKLAPYLGVGEYVPKYAKGLRNPLLYMLGELGLGTAATMAGEANPGEMSNMVGFRPDLAKPSALTWGEGLLEFGLNFVPHAWPALTMFNTIGQYKYGQDRAAGRIPGEMSYQEYKDYSLNLAGDSVSSFVGGLFKPEVTKQANGLAEDPLSSKWTKDGAATFNQTNYITVSSMDEVLKSLQTDVKDLKRQVGL